MAVRIPTSRVREPLRLRLREHRTSIVELTDEQARALRECGAGLTVSRRSPGRYDVTASHIVGVAVGRGYQVDILPKVPAHRLIYLLSFLRSPIRFDQLVPATSEDGFLDLVRRQYLAALGLLMRRGLLRDYRSVEAPVAAVRGRPDWARLKTRRFGLLPPVDCRFEEYDLDMEPNRRLLAAARTLTRLSADSATASELRALAGRFEGVSLVDYDPRQLRPLQRDRRLSHYEPALSLAELVLRRMSLELVDGHAKGLSFLVDMNKVYEDFAVAALRSALALDAMLFEQHPRGLRLDEAGRYTIEPDAVWWSGYHPTARAAIAVVDVKYKIAAELPQDDVRQMVAYCTSLGTPYGALVTPRGPEQTIRIHRSGIRIERIVLNPDGTPEELQNRAVRAANRLRLAWGMEE